MSLYDPDMPREIRTLPFNLLRSAIYPQNKPLTKQAVDEYIEGGPEVLDYLPQKMLYTKYKRGPANIQFGQNGVSVTDARRAHRDITWVENAHPAVSITLSERQAGDQYTRLPQPRDIQTGPPIARGVPNQYVLQPGAVRQYIEDSQGIPSGGSIPTIRKQTDMQAAEQHSGLGSVYRVMRTGGLGAADDNGAPEDPRFTRGMRAGAVIYGTLGMAAAGASVYHGYKRNKSVGWAIVWGLMGSLFPIITVPVAFAQGFGKRKR